MDYPVPPDPPLSGERDLLRQFSAGDAPAVSGACSDESVREFTFMEELTTPQAADWIERGLKGWSGGTARFAITSPPSDVCLGQIGIHFDFPTKRAEAFYWLDSEARGQGYAAEALGLVTTWAFRSYGFARVQLVAHVENEASQAVAERCGFSFEGVLRSWEDVKGSRPDVAMWSRLADDPAALPRI